MAYEGERWPSWFRLGVALGVLGLWGVSVVVRLVGETQTPVVLDALATIIVTFLFGREFGRAIREKISDAP